MCTQYVLVSILFISKIGVAETVKANFRSEVQFLASSRGREHGQMLQAYANGDQGPSVNDIRWD